MKKVRLISYFSIVILLLYSVNVFSQDAAKIVEDSFNYIRGETSVSTVKMTIHRPDWERSMSIKAYTKGRTESFFRITAPAKDKGNATLKKGHEMWMYNPKINRVIKLPPSMMSQGWMGSDFSNNDLSKTDQLITDYDHEIIGTETHEGKKVYVIKSMPGDEAPVVWGMQKLKIREDSIFLSQEFFDEDMESVKIMTTEKIIKISGKLFPVIWKMKKSDEVDEYTLLEYEELKFDVKLKKNVFTVSNLKKKEK